MTDPYIISHWGAEIITKQKWLLDQPALGMLEPTLADAFSQVERWDFRVEKAEISFSPIDDDGRISIVIDVYADLNNTQLDPEVEAVGGHKYHCKASCCQECNIPLCEGKLHPENGCIVGTIDHVMSM
jgi:hypothetical protein